ncbi:5-formyltetrahydrofolate cyclo-ligase [Coxiella endosymbiont of Amblyomma nuttalli]|uniref:5-formyltetrahydrofolate cyclo-ligase n=1 Tax=Coxiella endosymbiont of Amblyomma nuttalli TaxID=2749996 RepID=UPI001BA4C1E3|nr:5-formyltetrahydrofolate cyclo-ligase [Coxiella endosymbiont of Amblyomma nuttalli]QTS83610.1 putative 5-formyltetrahydrofolate cyclo-ligase [Coxiella endosymbiont of Amblyomma nuttalli]
MNVSTEKKRLRNLMRQKRNSFSPQQRNNLSHLICEKVMTLSLFQDSQQVAFYLTHDGEVDIKNLLTEALRGRKVCCLPALQVNQDHHLGFYSYQSGDLLIKNYFGIKEPDFSQKKSISIMTLDLIFLPLVAFDERGNRLGRGAGYYDRTLAFLQHLEKKPLLIGIAYEFQKVDTLFTEVWDIPLNLVVTEEEVYYF